MAFTVNNDPNGVVVVSVNGQLIVGNRNELKKLTIEALESGGSNFAFDFSSTGYIDSSGLGVLVSVSKKIREAGGDLRLGGLNEDLRMLFELTKLDTLFKICDTIEDAVNDF
ncbi:MAG: STAS domain-containing protein [Gemmatimonadetes bacterium]|nr:STAS domain-containing protein [Gemmatimonadota bacterium]